MSRLQAIENALMSINETVFQELCDNFLALRNNKYKGFCRTGSQSGNQKTIKGTPDTFLLLSNGKYMFVEYSTNITSGLKKLKEDLNKCIDESKTNISLDSISDIVLCVNFKLKPTEIDALKNLLVDTQIELTVYTLDILSIELSLQHRDLCHTYLGLPLDTGQIVSIEKFITEYNRASKRISTPLDNTFLHRENEILKFKQSIHNFDFIILTGSPGVGKTKLSIEVINNFVKENLNFEAYCISYKNHTLYDDLFQYFHNEKNYILFVDDANRIDAFNQIIGFYKADRKGKLKIIITVRNYAFKEVEKLCSEFAPKRINLNKLTNDQIVNIITIYPFNIFNYSFQRVIARIANGNPRLAIMIALLANKGQDISILQDVSDLFEKYYSTFIIDNGEFASEINIKCLGIIGFFYTIPYKNKEITNSILRDFNIEYSTFIDIIDKLDDLELVEIQYDYVKIQEQNLSNYFFYRTFIKDNFLSFEILLEKYFESNHNYFVDSIIPANNTFGSKKVMSKIEHHLINHWEIVIKDEELAFKFLNLFWSSLQLQSLDFILNIINTLPTCINPKFELPVFENLPFRRKGNIIELLGEFFSSINNLNDSIELAFAYVRKKPECLSELIEKINEKLFFRFNDHENDFARQKILFKILIHGLKNKDVLYSKSFYILCKTFLPFEFQYTLIEENDLYDDISCDDINIRLTSDFRKNIWEAIEKNFHLYTDDSMTLLDAQLLNKNFSTDQLMMFELPFIIRIIEKNLNNDSFIHCRYVQNLILLYEKNNIVHSDFRKLKQQFTNLTYEIFLKIDRNHSRDKERLKFNDYSEYDILKINEIRTSFIFDSNKEIKIFYKAFIYLKSIATNGWHYCNALEYIIDENSSFDFKIGSSILKTVVESGNPEGYIPSMIFGNQLKKARESKLIWNIIKSKEFISKSNWEMSFFENIDISIINLNYAEELINSVTNMTTSSLVRFHFLEKFLLVKPDLFQIILKILSNRNEKENTRLKIFIDYTRPYVNSLLEDIELIKKTYLQQEKIDDSFDYEKVLFLKILEKDKKFLVEYMNEIIYQKEKDLSNDLKDFSFIWKIDNIDTIMINIFDLIIDKKIYFGISEHFCNSFFRNLQTKEKEKAKLFLYKYCESNYHNLDSMKALVDITRHTMREIFEEILLLFISLNQDRNFFSKISWRGNSTSGSGETILADIRMADWKRIQLIIEKSNIGIKLIPIKNYLNEKIIDCKNEGDWERQRRFLRRHS